MTICCTNSIVILVRIAESIFEYRETTMQDMQWNYIEKQKQQYFEFLQLSSRNIDGIYMTKKCFTKRATIFAFLHTILKFK